MISPLFNLPSGKQNTQPAPCLALEIILRSREKGTAISEVLRSASPCIRRKIQEPDE